MTSAAAAPPQVSRGQLKALRQERTAAELKELTEAAQHYQLFKDKEIPWVPADSGFVCSLADVEAFVESQLFTGLAPGPANRPQIGVQRRLERQLILRRYFQSAVRHHNFQRSFAAFQLQTPGVCTALNTGASDAFSSSFMACGGI